MVCLPASYVFSGRFDIESGPPSIPQGQNLSLYFDLVAFLSQLFKIPFVQLLGQAVFLNYAEFVPLNTTVEPSLKATSDHNNHLCTKATFLSRQTVHTLNLQARNQDFMWGGANEAKVDQTTEMYFLLSDPFI